MVETRPTILTQSQKTALVVNELLRLFEKYESKYIIIDRFREWYEEMEGHNWTIP